MAHELDIKKEGVVSLVDDKGLDVMIKPLTHEIHLFDSYVAGTAHLTDKSVLNEINEGDILALRREANKFDDNAIVMQTTSKKKLGYVPEKDNIIFARLMDAGKMLQARITKLDKKGSFTKINVGIYLIDF